MADGLQRITNERGSRVKEKLNRYVAKDVLAGVRKNFRMQHINPFQTAKGVNLGDGSLFRRMYYKVYNSAGGDVAKIELFYLEHGMYADMGLGAGVPVAKQYGMPASRRKRYAVWKDKDKQPKVGINRWQRPAIGPEIRYQSIRLGYWLAANYELDANTLLTYAFGDDHQGFDLPDDAIRVPTVTMQKNIKVVLPG